MKWAFIVLRFWNSGCIMTSRRRLVLMYEDGKIMKKLLAYAAVSSLALILVACGGGKKTEIVKTTPEEILKTYQAGASAGDKKFKGVKVEVTGTVGETDQDLNGVPFMTFALDNEVLPVFNFKKELAKSVASLKAGDKVTLVCVGAGELVRTPTFKDCEFAINVPAGGKK